MGFSTEQKVAIDSSSCLAAQNPWVCLSQTLCTRQPQDFSWRLGDQGVCRRRASAIARCQQRSCHPACEGTTFWPFQTRALRLWKLRPPIASSASWMAPLNVLSALWHAMNSCTVHQPRRACQSAGHAQDTEHAFTARWTWPVSDSGTLFSLLAVREECHSQPGLPMHAAAPLCM